MKIALLVISVIAYIGAPIGLLMLLFKRFRSRGIKLLIGSVVVIPLAGFGYGYLSELEAKQAGFRDANDQSFARLHGFSSAEEWSNNRDRVHAEIREGVKALREEKKRTAEAERQAEERRMAEAAVKPNAEELAKKSAHKRKLATKTHGITEDVVAVLKREYSIEPQPSTQNEPFCRDDGYCQLNVGRFRIEVMGAGVVDIQTTSQEPHSRYRECVPLFLVHLLAPASTSQPKQ